MYPEYVDTAGNVNKIRELLLDNTKDPSAMVGGPSEWAKFVRIGTLFRNTRLVAAFEGVRMGSEAVEGFELPHICRQIGFRFAGCRYADF